MDEVTVEERVATSAETAYELVSDVTKMGQWSPETTSCRWVGGGAGPALGARFRGSNQRGWRRWSTTCTVVAAEPAKRFAFDVKFGPLTIARWTYEFIPEGDACRIRESWTDQRPGWMSRLDTVVMGIPDRSQHNRETMQATLAQIARYPETSRS